MMMISVIMMMILFDQVGISLEGIILGHYDDYDDDNFCDHNDDIV